MRTMLQLGRHILVLTLLGTTGAAGAASIGWEVVDKFRLLDDPDDFPRLLQQLGTAPAQAAAGRTAEFPSPLKPWTIQLGGIALPATAWLPRDQRYRPGYAHPAAWSVKASLVGVPRGASCVWRHGADRKIEGACTGQVIDQVAPGDDLAVSVAGSELLRARTRLAIVHRRIVVLGDSFASGEGVPDINRPASADESGRATFSGHPYWWDQKCHRSLLSAGVQSAMRWAAARPERTATVLSYACSGAEIGDLAGTDVRAGGILGDYVGRETREQLHHRRYREGTHADHYDENLQVPEAEPLPSQVNQALRDLCRGPVGANGPVWTCDAGIAPPDLVILGIGGNDVGFGEIIKKAVLSECDSGCISSVSAAGFSTLAERYGAMADALNAHLKARRTLLLDYGDPTRDGEGNFCRHDGSPFSARSTGFLLFRVSQREYRDAYDLVIRRLNRAGNDLTRAQNGNGWHRLGAMEGLTRTKGICSKKSWFNGSWAAWAKQGNLPQELYSSGAVHPNIIYHSRQSALIADWMERSGF